MPLSAMLENWGPTSPMVLELATLLHGIILRRHVNAPRDPQEDCHRKSRGFGRKAQEDWKVWRTTSR